MNTQSANLASDTIRQHWDAAAEGWDAHAPVLEPWLSMSTATMITMAGIRSGSHVLDVAAGGGQQALAIASHVGGEGRITCTDLSSLLIDRLRENASRLAAMERADQNISELLETLRSRFNQLRQSGIDEELFDVISGFEALTPAAREKPAAAQRAASRVTASPHGDQT